MSTFAPRTRTLLLIIAFGVIYLGWGTTYLANHFLLLELPPFVIGSLRFSFAGLLALTWVVLSGQLRIQRSDWGSVLLGGLTMPVGVATSLVIIAMKSFVGFGKYYWVMAADGAVFDWNTIGLMIVAGIAGSYIGAAVGKRLPKQQLQRGFALFLVIMAAVVIYQSVL